MPSMSTHTASTAGVGQSSSQGGWWRPWLAVAAGGVVIAALSVALFGVSGRDDPYITFSAAEAIRDTGSLVNINGDEIEQSTTLLFTLVLAGLSAIVPLPTPELGWLLGMLFLVALVVTSFGILRRTVPSHRAVIGAWVVGLTPPLVYWATSGAEQTMGVALVLMCILLIPPTAPAGWHIGRFAAAACLTLLTFLCRPDLGLAVVAATGLLVIGRFLVGRRSGQQQLLATLAGQVALITVVSLARLGLTGSPLPQPLNAKVGGNLLEQALRGLEYVGNNAVSWWCLGVLAAGAWAAWVTRRHPWTSMQVLALLIALVLIVGSVLSGGDWMELGRFFAAPAALLTLITVALLGSAPGRSWALWIPVIVVLQGGALITWALHPVDHESRGSSITSRWTLETTGSPGVPAELRTPFNEWNADHLGDAYFLGAAIPAIRQVVDAHPGRILSVTSGQGGMIPYYLHQEFGTNVRFIDRFQLMTDDFAACGLTPGPYGAFISWNQWETMAGDCAPPLPDLAFSIGPIPYDDLGDDYEVVVHVEGTAERNGQSLPQEQWLAVRKDLLASS